VILEEGRLKPQTAGWFSKARGARVKHSLKLALITKQHLIQGKICNLMGSFLKNGGNKSGCFKLFFCSNELVEHCLAQPRCDV
jgi:hypothetical protein